MKGEGDARPERLTVGSFVCLLARFIRYALPLWDKLLLRVLLGQCSAMTWIVMAAGTAKAVDAGLHPGDARVFFFWLGVAIGVQVLNVLILFLIDATAAYVKMRVDLRLKRTIFDHLERLSVRFQDSRPVGESMFRVNNDTTAATTLAADTLPDLVEKAARIVTMASLIFTLNSMLALLIGVYMFLYVVYARFTTALAAHYQWVIRARAQSALAVLQENLGAVALRKAHGRERHERRRYFGRMAGVARASVGYGIVRSALIHGLEFLREWFFQLAYVLFCGHLVMAGRMSVGEYLAVNSLILLVTIPLQELVFYLQVLRISAVPALRVLETLDAWPEVVDAPGAQPLEAVSGRITFENVSFRYRPEGPEVLDKLSFVVEPGRKLAIVGMSGAGKSTVFNLLMRFYDPCGGRVLIDGKDLASVRLGSYRRHVSIVLQDNFLYSATVRDNILFGNTEATPGMVAEAVRRAGLVDLVRQLPQGLDTLLKEGGNLSAGQKQRIAIARAIVRDPKLLFLDEATASLDPITEAEILEQLRQIEAGRTRIVISHNIASVRDADEILVLERGVLAQRGTHETLITEPGPYRRMWEAEEDQAGGPFVRPLAFTTEKTS